MLNPQLSCSCTDALLRHLLKREIPQKRRVLIFTEKVIARPGHFGRHEWDHSWRAFHFRSPAQRDACHWLWRELKREAAVKPHIPLPLILNSEYDRQARAATVWSFVNTPGSILVCTDATSRGLDFAEVGLLGGWAPSLALLPCRGRRIDQPLERGVHSHPRRGVSPPRALALHRSLSASGLRSPRDTPLSRWTRSCCMTGPRPRPSFSTGPAEQPVQVQREGLSCCTRPENSTLCSRFRCAIRIALGSTGGADRGAV